MMRRRDTRPEGLTLVELLVAMSIFAVLGVFLFTLIRNSLTIYRSANSSGELYDKFAQGTSDLAEDLGCVAIGDPEGPGIKLQFLLSHDRPQVRSEEAEAAATPGALETFSVGDPRSFLLRFVRSFPGGELEDTIGRFAGTYREAEAVYDGVNDLEESRVRKILEKRRAGNAAVEDEQKIPGLMPPGNLMEVMYFLDSGPDDLDGTFTLYRARRAPVGGKGSFFRDETIQAMSPEWVERHAEPVVSGILYFGMALWSQDTLEWGTDRTLDGYAIGAEGRRELSELWWDSTRSRYESFSLHKGQASAANFEDDVFPSKVRLVMTVVPEGALMPDARLTTSASAQGKNLRIDRTDVFEVEVGEEARYLKVGDEWVKVRSVAGRDLVVERGARATRTSKHDAGTPVMMGRTFRMTIEIPAHRSWFLGPGERR